MLKKICYNYQRMNYVNSQNLIRILTSARLSSYRTCDGINILENYAYNIKLAESLYPALNLLEITLRNNICYAIENLIKKEWLISEYNKQQILGDKEYQKVKEAVNSINKQGKKLTNDRLIAEMTFGFWIHLCTKTYKPKFWDKKGFFEIVFPNYQSKTKLRQIAPIQNDLRTILRLRNRIFHHEIITNGRITPTTHYQMIQNLIHLMSDEMVQFLDEISRFPDIVKQKP